jgi:hypothetical protein
MHVIHINIFTKDGGVLFEPLAFLVGLASLNSFSSGRKVEISSGVVLNAYIFQTIHRTETEIASFKRGGLPLSNDTNFA